MNYLTITLGTILLVSSVCAEDSEVITTIVFDGGEFMQGASDDDQNASSNEKPMHPASVASFEISASEISGRLFGQFAREQNYVTHEEARSPDANWKNLLLKNGNTSPVARVSWQDATAFCAWLGGKLKKECRLPTESEWEYAVSNANSAKNVLQRELSVEDRSSNTPSILPSIEREAQIELFVKSMLSMPSEWCGNHWLKYGAPGFKVNPSQRVMRGNSVSGEQVAPRLTVRSFAHEQYYTHENLGFRVVFPNVQSSREAGDGRE
jgi:formylglycine-generating enzyme required for sulfatase activity